MQLALRTVVTLMTGLAVAARAAHPVVLVSEGDRAAMRRKVQEVPWARASFERMHERIDGYVERHRTDPEWITSRMLMNWDGHYTTPIVERDRWVRGEGRAPVPTPRYAGQRDWAGEYSLPGIDELKPYNDKGGLIWARDRKGEYQWVHPAKTGHSIEGRNRAFMGLARDAAFVYWLTGDPAYAKFATDIFWPYVYGFSFKRMPHNEKGIEVGREGGPRNIYGSQTFEVIHDGIVRDIAVTYDFLHDYLVADGKDVGLVQEQLRRMANRVVDGGGREGNWNLHQAETIAYAGLALEDDAAYADGKGKQYYIDVVLNADLPCQKGLRQVMRTGYDQETGIWPEAFGYGTGVTVSVTQIASLVARQQTGESVLDDPLLAKAALVQFQWLFPNGRSIALGDTTHAKARPEPLELLVAHLRRAGNTAVERQLTAALQHEVAAGRYDRGAGLGLTELCLYVSELAETDQDSGFRFDRVFDGSPLNAVIQRNLVAADPMHSMAAALYGSRGGHIHANGLALELFGAGEIVGPDSGVGSSYWQKDHGEYYKQRPAHNTVIVDGASVGELEMTVPASEPQPGSEGVSPHFGFVEAEMNGGRPEAEQRRLLALLRTSPTTGFYVDIFRSRAKDAEHRSHDYLYHNTGQDMRVMTLDGNPLELGRTEDLGSEHGDQKGYNYFSNKRSVDCTDDFRVQFATRLDERTVVNSLWMLGGPERTVYAMNAPRIIRATRGGLPREIAELPLQALLVRQRSEAWEAPFVAVFEPHADRDGETVKSVERMPVGDSGLAIRIRSRVPGEKGDQPSDMLVLLGADDRATVQADGTAMSGRLGIVEFRSGKLIDVYLGKGMALSAGTTSIRSATGEPVSADLRVTGAGWEYASTGAVEVVVPDRRGQTLRLETGMGGAVPVAVESVRDDNGEPALRVRLPAGSGRLSFAE